MKLKKESTAAGNLITAITDQELFKHCNGGRDTASPGRFTKHVKPLLIAHGVLEFRFVD